MLDYFQLADARDFVRANTAYKLIKKNIYLSKIRLSQPKSSLYLKRYNKTMTYAFRCRSHHRQ